MKKILMSILVLGAAIAALTSAAEVTIPERSLTGVVIDRLTGERVSMASVRLAPAGTSEVSWTTMTDTDGRFILGRVPFSGTLRLSVRAHGYHDARDGMEWPAGDEPIDVEVGLTSLQRDRPDEPMLVLREAPERVEVVPAHDLVASEVQRVALESMQRALEGEVRDTRSGTALEGVEVIVLREGDARITHRALTDATGHFRIEALDVARHRMEFRHPDFQALRFGVQPLAGSERLVLNVRMLGIEAPGAARPGVEPPAGGPVQAGYRMLSAVELSAIRIEGEAALPLPPITARDTTIYGPLELDAGPTWVQTLEDLSFAEVLGETLSVEQNEKTEPAPTRGGETYVRGGRSGEVSFRVGGVAVENPTAGDADVGAPQGGSIRRAVPLPTARSVADADPVTDEALARLARDSDELWILERPAAQPAPDADRGPGTGCLVVIQDDEEEVPVPLEHTDVHARIDGYIASVDVRQRFHNPFDETIEAEYLFPLPHDAAVNDFLMIVGERRIRGIIREKEEAREIYEWARRAGHVASLLEQERPNVFRQRVANIEPGHAIEVELHYFNALPYRKGAFEFAFPLVVGPRFNPPGSEDPIAAVPRGTQAAGTAVSYLAPDERSGHDVSITVELDAGVSIEGLQSLNHATSVERDGGSRALVTLAPHDRIPNRDFVLSYRVASDAIKSGVLVHREGEEGYFSMMLVPPASLEQLRRAPVEFVFVLDCSGSMNGWPMEQSKAAMRRALRQLRTGDSFQVIRFSENASALGPAPVEATAANVERGLAYVDQLRGSGGTMMIEGIKAALDFPRDRERERIVSFMTDGYIGNEAEIFAAVAERIGGARIFSFGVGSSVNRHLVEGLARMGRGAVAYVGLQDDLQAVDEFYRIVRHPALTDVTVDWGAMAAKQVFPQQMHDLFVGRPLLLHGRFDGTGQTTVTVRGRAGGRTVEMAIDVDLDAIEKRESLPLLWARSEIGHISDQLARRSDDSLQSRGLDLALDYNLVSDWTSFVAVDASAVVDEPGTRTETVPVPVPEGVKYETTVKGNGR